MSDSSSDLPARRRPSRGILLLALLLIIVLPALLYGAIFMPSPLSAPVTVIVTHGMSVKEIATLLEKDNAIISSVAFRVAAKFLGADSLKTGEYEIVPHESTADIVTGMHDGKSVVHMFTAAEGLTSTEIIALMRSNPALAGDVAIPPDGSLLPETYRYSYGDTRASIVTRMQKAMQDTLADLWNKRDQTIPLGSPPEVVVMASIIEKETGKAIERPRIAGVFYNRLHQNMRLQSDPTVIYAIERVKGPMDHDLGHDDLSFPSPFNTYASDGLPPEPICNPGRASLEAAMHPEQNDFLYFVADGTGGHVFARNLVEHNQNVTRSNNARNKP